MPVDAHSSPPSTRTTSERVNTPASAQNDNALSGAATNSIIAKAAVTWPSVTNEASISTSSHPTATSRQASAVRTRYCSSTLRREVSLRFSIGTPRPIRY